MKKVKFDKPRTQENSPWTDWQRPIMTNYHMACCDCDLVHTINFRVLEVIKVYKNGKRGGNILPKNKYIIEFKIRRNEKLTKQERKNDKNS